MTLTGKDIITTILAVTTIALYYAVTKGINLPLISGYRMATLLLGIIGIAMCAFGSGTGATAAHGMWAIVEGALGITALILIIAGLITGTKLTFILLTVTILGLWIMATIRHFMGQ